MDFRRLLAPNTTDDIERAESELTKHSVRTMTSVLASVNKLKFISQRSLAAKGNVTNDTPLKKFDATAVTREIEDILKTVLKDFEYEPNRVRFMSKSLSETIKSKVKSMKFPRYKFVTTVSIMSKNEASMVISSRCLWNTDSDSYASAQYTNGSIAAVATLYAIFNE
ncbi:hypothetical protein ACF0H5_016916 [Mactra antiquata]